VQHRFDIAVFYPLGSGNGNRALILGTNPTRASIVRSQVTGVTVTPPQTTVQRGASQQFTATVSGTSNQNVTWAISGSALGSTLSSSGLFTAGQTPGTVFVTATSVADPSAVGVAQVTIPGTTPAQIAATARVNVVSLSTLDCSSLSPPVSNVALPVTLSLSCTGPGNFGLFGLNVNIAQSGNVVTFTSGATVPAISRSDSVEYSGFLSIVPAVSGTLTVGANPIWSTGTGDAAWSITATTAGVSVTSEVDVRGGTVFTSQGPGSVPVVGGRGVSVSFAMSCNGNCSGSGPQLTVTLPQ
jgi:hypothetical protein